MKLVMAYLTHYLCMCRTMADGGNDGRSQLQAKKSTLGPKLIVAVSSKLKLFSVMFCLLVVFDSLTVAEELLHVQK